jgi:pimeloyl-ACP methyl ester carboxylesterase
VGARTEIQSVLAGHPGLMHRARLVRMRFELRASSARVQVAVDGPNIRATPAQAGDGAGVSKPEFTIEAADEAWQEFAKPLPAPGYHDLLALLGAGNARFEGDGLPFYTHLFLVKGLVDAVFRGEVRGWESTKARDDVAWMPGEARHDSVVARYLRLDIQSRPHRVFIEEAGEGVPLLCLHTAGADSRQYRHLLSDAEVTSRFRVIAFDLPWHGKSSPPAGFQDERYALTPQLYVDTVMAVVRGLALDRPIVLGCSIGGRAVLHLLVHHPDAFCAAVGLQSSMTVSSTMGHYQRELQYLGRSDVHGAEAASAMVSGTMAPHSPTAEHWETLWHYMQGGPGVMQGDMTYYKESALTADELARIDTARTPVHLLTGEYDYGASPARGREVATLIPGARFDVMPGLGHFPPSENYPALRAHLLPVLDGLHAHWRH